MLLEMLRREERHQLTLAVNIVTQVYEGVLVKSEDLKKVNLHYVPLKC